MSLSSGAVPVPGSPVAPPATTTRWLMAAAAPLPYIVLLAAAYSVFCVTTDDPFITYRYAANILARHGPVFNIGERVEGFSSPLHLLLCVLLLKIVPAADILFKAKLVGLCLAALAVWQTGRLARVTGLSGAGALVAQLLVALNTNFALGGVNGLETSLYTCLVLAAVLAFIRELNGRVGPQSAVWLFLVFLTRPDGLLIFALLLAVRFAWAVRRGRVGRDVVGWATIFLLLTVGFLLARYAYYGQWVPNTYYAKQVAPVWGLREGKAYLLHPLFPTALYWPSLHGFAAFWAQKWPVLGVITFWGLALTGLLRLASRWTGWVLFVIVAAQTAFVLRFGGDWMPGWRFLIPSVPLLAVLQCHGLRALRLPTAVGKAAAPVLALLLWGECAFAVPHDPWSNVHFSTQSADLLAADNALGRKWVVVNRYIEDTVEPGSVVAYSEMGFAGYRNLDVKFIDVRGLTDREIARLPASYKGSWGVDDEAWMLPTDPLYQIFQRRKPSVIIAFSHPAQMPSVVLDRYYFTAAVHDPRDPWWQMPYALVYRPPDGLPNPAQ